MLRLLQYLPLKAMALGVRVSAGKLPFKADAGTLVPDETISLGTEAQPVADNPAALEARVLEVLRAASKLPPGSPRRDALAEVHGLRQRAI